MSILQSWFILFMSTPRSIILLNGGVAFGVTVAGGSGDGAAAAAVVVHMLLHRWLLLTLLPPTVVHISKKRRFFRALHTLFLKKTYYLYSLFSLRKQALIFK